MKMESALAKSSLIGFRGISYLICISMLFFAACKSRHKVDDHSGHTHEIESHEGHDHNHEYDQEGDHNHDHEEDLDIHAQMGITASDEIVFTKTQAQSAGLKIYEVKRGGFKQVIKTGGQILSAQGDESVVVATTSGIVSFGKTQIAEGVQVRAGESLLAISSKNIADGDPALKARLNFETAQKEFQRAESLIGDKLISQKEYEQIKLNYETSKVAYNAVAKSQTTNGVSVSASMSGFIKNKLVNEGDFVSVGQPLFTITQNKRLQLKADISERYYKDLQTISSANFKTPYDAHVYKISEMNGRLLSFGKSSNTQEYYIPVYFEFDNVGQIVSGAYVEVFLLSKPLENVLSVPTTSLIEEQGLFFVYKQIGEESFLKQEVRVGNNNGENVQILSGLNEGEKVASKGVYHIKLASNSGVMPEGHSH